VVNPSPDWLVGAFFDVDEPGLSARRILVSLHVAGEETPDREVVHLREHIVRCSCVLLYGAGSEMVCCSQCLTIALFLSPRHEVAMSLLTESLCDPTYHVDASFVSYFLCEVAQSNYYLLDSW
jgi:hypothetical protein